MAIKMRSSSYSEKVSNKTAFMKKCRFYGGATPLTINAMKSGPFFRVAQKHP